LRARTDARPPTLLRDAKTVGVTNPKLSVGAGCDPSPRAQRRLSLLLSFAAERKQIIKH